MRSDLRDAFRALRRSPAFTIVAILTLGLASADATTVFSVVDAVVLRGLPYASAGRLQTVYESADQSNLRVPSYPTFKDWQARAASVRDAIDGFAFIRGDGVFVPGADGPERQIAAYVTPGFFDLMGTRPMLGRTFRPDEEQLGATRVAVLSYAFFMKQYGGDRTLVGKTIPIDSIQTTVIGVMPRGFAYPNFSGGGGWAPPALWQPIAVFQNTHNTLSLRGLHVDSRAILRLRAGADSARAAAAMRTIAQALAIEYPADQGHWTSVSMQSLSNELFGQLWSTLFLISAAVGLVMLLACANVANLLLVRSSVRARELAVRAAMGASTWRLARYLLVEASLIAGAAGVAGIGLSTVLLRLLRPYAGQRLPFVTAIAIDERAALFTIGSAVMTALLIGVLPALHANRGSLVARLRGGGAVDGRGVAERRARNLLVTIQFALAITVLVGAGLLIQSVRRVSSIALGYEPDGIVSLAIAPPAKRYTTPAEALALYQRLLTAMRAVPSVTAVAAGGGGILPAKVETDGQAGGAAPPIALYHPISADYLKVLHVPIAAGRGFGEDDMRSPSGFLVTETLAKQVWPNSSAIGKRITVHRSSQARPDFGQPITMPIVGVVTDYRQYGPEQKAPAQVFLPYSLEVWPWMTFEIRAPNPSAILAQVTNAVKSVEPAIQFYVKPSAPQTGVRGWLADPRVFVATIMSAFAATALIVAAIGLYGIVAYGVSQRTREIGIRIAVGATSRSIVILVLRHAVVLVVVGVGVGLLGAALGTRFIQAMLFETTTTDLTTFIIVPAVLAVVALIASVIPAGRAARTDPIVAIRAE